MEKELWAAPRGVMGETGLLPLLRAAASLPGGSYFLGDGSGLSCSVFQQQLPLGFRNSVGLGEIGEMDVLGCFLSSFPKQWKV